MPHGFVFIRFGCPTAALAHHLGSAESIVNTPVCIIFPVLRENFSFGWHRGGFQHHFERFLVTSETCFLIFEGLGRRLFFCYAFSGIHWKAQAERHLRDHAHLKGLGSSLEVARSFLQHSC